MRLPFTLLAALATAAVLAPPADAVPLVVTDGTSLVSVDTNNLSSPSAPVPVTGMQPGEVLVGIDQRPATGQLYGIGNQNRIYVLDPASGAASQVGAPGAFSLNGTAFGTEVNPVPDRIRLVSNNEQNLRLNPNDGSLTGTDAPLNPAGNVVAAAYNNNVAGATSTTLFDIDSVDGKLYTQGGAGGTPSPNGGVLTQIGSLGLGTTLNENIGFDIGADGSAFATITTLGVSKLYGINTTTGASTNLGTIGTGATPYSGLAIMPARIRLTSAGATASEGSTATFEVTRNAPAAGAVTVDYATAAGTATSGEDFTPANGTLTWGAGESGSRTFAVPVPADAAAEGDETFSVSLSNVTGADAVLGAPTTATATIAANEAPPPPAEPGPTIQFGAPSASATEGGSATLQLTRVGSATQPVSVQYATAPGSASESDYTPATGTVSWAAGDSAPKTISIPITDDPAQEGQESFSVGLSNPGGGATLGSPAAATVTIAASDPLPTLKLGGTKKQKLATVKRKGVSISATVDSACRLSATVKRGKRTVGSAKKSLSKGKNTVKVKIKSKERKRLRAKQKLSVSATCTSTAGKSTTAERTVTLKR